MPTVAKVRIDATAAHEWSVRWVRFGALNHREVFTSPDGAEYVRAQSGHVDLEIPMRMRGLPALRLRRRDASAQNLLQSRAAAVPAATGAEGESPANHTEE